MTRINDGDILEKFNYLKWESLNNGEEFYVMSLCLMILKGKKNWEISFFQTETPEPKQRRWKWLYKELPE